MRSRRTDIVQATRRMVTTLILMLSGIPAFGQTTYYVSSSTGNNANNGTSQNSPWYSIDKLFTKTPAFQPGDSILLKRGDAFDGALRVTLRGTEANPIVVGAYGVGPKPIIKGDLPTASWTAVPGRIGYYKTSVGEGSIITKGYEPTTPMAAKSEGSLNLSNPTDLATFLNGFGPSSFGPIGSTNTVWVRTKDGQHPSKVHLFRDANFIWAGSKHAVIRDLVLTNINTGLDLNADTNIIVRNVAVRNSLAIGIYLRTANYRCVVDSCTTDSTGYTALYNLKSSQCVFRANRITDVVTSVLGIPVGGEKCAIGIQGSESAAYDVIGNNTIEYNVASNAQDCGVDFYYNDGDTVRYNTFSGMTAGIFPNGTRLVVVGNTVTLTNGGSGLNVSNHGPGLITITNNTILGITNYGIMVSANQNGGLTVLSGNTAQSMSPISVFVDFLVAGTSSTGNTFRGPGRWSSMSVQYPSLTSFQSATGLEAGSLWFSSAGSPTGMFTVIPDSLPVNGGTVILQWSSSDATSASIRPLIGSVATTGSDTVTVTGTTLFVLSLTGPFGVSVYTAEVFVAVPVPPSYGLGQNYPNPFNGTTIIRYDVALPSPVSLKVYNTLGQKVATLVDELLPAGTYTVRFDGTAYASGVYYYSLKAGPYTETRKLILLR